MYQYEAIASVRIICETESQADAEDKMTRILQDCVYEVEDLRVL